MKYTKYLILSFLLSCSQPAHDQLQLETLNKIYQDQLRLINEWTKEGYNLLECAGHRRKDQEVFENALSIIKHRYQSSKPPLMNQNLEERFKIGELEKYYGFLYSKIVEADEHEYLAHEIESIEYYISALKSNFDHLNHAYLMINICNVEINIIESYMRQIGTSDCIYLGYNLQHNGDTAYLEQPYKITILPFDKPMNSSSYQYEDIKLYSNGKKIALPVSIEQVGHAAILTVFPSTPGSYSLKGLIIENSIYFETPFSQKFNHSFYVQDSKNN